MTTTTSKTTMSTTKINYKDDSNVGNDDKNVYLDYTNGVNYNNNHYSMYKDYNDIDNDDNNVY